MDYDFTRLGDREFEHVVQALFLKDLGCEGAVFGDGKDGGREASWRGQPGPQSVVTQAWNSYGVVQAKFRGRPYQRPDANSNWVKSQMLNELRDWKTKRSTLERPKFMIVATNLVLSSVPGHGADQLEKDLLTEAKRLRLGIRGIRVWHADTLRAFLDAQTAIRTRYLAWLTPGDLIAELLDTNRLEDSQVKQALTQYTAKVLLDETDMNLSQAGSVGDTTLGIHQLFVDLPGSPATQSHTGENDWTGIAAALIRVANTNHQASESEDARDRRHVLVGGPGQGKSTLGQYLCQVMRAHILTGTAIALNPETKDAIKAIVDSAGNANLPKVSARRWPFRVVLTDFADALAADPDLSMLQYMAEKISTRSASPIDSNDLRIWLTLAPWFLVIDGLDEVPRSSNRNEVVQKLADFTLDADSVNADVVTVATTRPQGYEDDFDPNRYRHVTLNQLPAPVALAYADKFLRLRLGEGERRDQAMRRLVRASEEDGTSRLMVSPLQVTILALLIDRQGQAPKERWRLFDQYYQLIYQREQEKGGPLADLLNDYQTDISAIHARAGDYLQRRAETAGETEGVLTLEEFHGLIKDRLREQGHAGDELTELVRRFAVATTDRLVFLSALRDDSIGFEVRSLQEFMAAEHVMTKTPSEIHDAIESMAMSGFWRNVVLFVVGSIFVRREDLRDGVVVKCDSLNLQEGPLGAVHAGSRLALAVIAEGIVWNLPMYRKLMTKRVCEALTTPSEFVDEVATALSSLDREAMLAELTKCWDGPIGARLAAARLCVNPLARTMRANLPAISELWRGHSEDVPPFLELANSTGSAELINALTPEMPILGPGFIAARTATGIDELDEDELTKWIERHTVPKWYLAALYLAGNSMAMRGGRGTPLQVRAKPRVDIFLKELGADIAMWQEVVGLEDFAPQHPEWGALAAVARFNIDPNAVTLADALDQLAVCGGSASDRLARTSAWPLSGALKFDYLKDWESKTSRWEELAVFARAGLCGDLEDWRATQERLFKAGAVDIAEWCHTSDILLTTGEPLPVWRGLVDRGVPGYSVSVSSAAHGAGDVDVMMQSCRDILALIPTVAASVQREALLGFAALDLYYLGRGKALHGRSVATAEASPVPDEAFEVARELAGVTEGSDARWLALCPVPPDEATVALARKFGAIPNVHVPSSAVHQYFVELWSNDPSQWKLARLALIADSTDFLKPRNRYSQEIDAPALSGAANLQARVEAAHSLLTGQNIPNDDPESSRIPAHAVDQLMAKLETQEAWPSRECDVIDIDFLARSPLFLLSSETFDDKALRVASEVARRSTTTHPGRAGRFTTKIAARLAAMPPEPTI